MRLTLLIALLAMACSSKSHSPADVCKHLTAIMPAAGGEKCPAELAKMKEQIGEKKFAELTSCFMSASDKEAVATCGMKAVSSGDMKTYQSKSKASEAKVMTRKMADGARVFYMTPQVVDVMEAPVPTLPESVGPTPAKGACCKDGGEKCAPNLEDWQHPSWLALNFEMSDPHYYSYEFKRGDDGKSFTALAYGDLDCDGTYSTYKTIGTWDEATEMHELTEETSQELE